MFDQYVLGHGRSYPSTVHHHEHRAPTDDSVRLLREMEQAADDKRIASFPIESNHFRGHVELIAEDMHGTQSMRCIFELNGHRCVVTVNASLTEIACDPSALCGKLHEAVSKRIAAELLHDFLKGHPTL